MRGNVCVFSSEGVRVCLHKALRTYVSLKVDVLQRMWRCGSIEVYVQFRSKVLQLL